MIFRFCINLTAARLHRVENKNNTTKSFGSCGFYKL
jgi:hypothetical protein